MKGGNDPTNDVELVSLLRHEMKGIGPQVSCVATCHQPNVNENLMEKRRLCAELHRYVSRICESTVPHHISDWRSCKEAKASLQSGYPSEG